MRKAYLIEALRASRMLRGRIAAITLGEVSRLRRVWLVHGPGGREGREKVDEELKLHCEGAQCEGDSGLGWRRRVLE